MTVTFAYQSQDISFGEWTNLFTLCLAPLVAHIFAGVPSPTVLDSSELRWHDVVGHYNPTSILWRYFAIADRRLRAKSWCAEDMAISNAVLWTSRGWSGSEDLMRKCRFLYKAPRGRKGHIDVVSASMMTTVVVTLQGIQALYLFITGIKDITGFNNNLALNTIFSPVAIFGLLRLPAAIWIDSHAFDNVQMSENLPASRFLLGTGDCEGGSEKGESNPVHYHGPHSCRGIFTRTVFLLSIASLLGVTITLMGPFGPPSVMLFTTTTLLVSTFYSVILLTSLITYTIVIFLNYDNTTILPCITSAWYKIYTGVVAILMVVMVTIAALETRPSLQGRYTTVLLH
jgi:hypothetical protein